MKISSAACEDSEVALVVYDLLQVPVPHILSRHIPAWVEEEVAKQQTPLPWEFGQLPPAIYVCLPDMLGPSVLTAT